MNDRLENFYRSLRGRRVAMLGIGRSNTPLVKLFISKGAEVTVCDRRRENEVAAQAEEFRKMGAALRLGDDYLKDLDFDMVMRTPGIKFTLPELTEARRKGVCVVSEMELFFDVCPCRIVAVTGSDGKTTTTTLISEMLKLEGKKVHLGGNIGRPLLPEIESVGSDDWAVVELSSFQLISMRRSPDVAVITNISPNHLDVHRDMAEYIDSKRNILIHQTGFGRAVLNLDNSITAPMAGEARGEVMMFSRKNDVAHGCVCTADGEIIMRSEKGDTRIMNASDILLPGTHNVENYLAAISAVWGSVSIETIRTVAQNFAGVEHRMELVRTLRGARYYNDSIATTPTRTIAGLNAWGSGVILIAGGYDKNIPFDALGPKIVDKVKLLILLGNTADKIEASVKAARGYREGRPEIIRVASLEEAVDTAAKAAAAGDIVTLSPACASFDMFGSYEERGEIFRELVNALK